MLALLVGAALADARNKALQNDDCPHGAAALARFSTAPPRSTPPF